MAYPPNPYPKGSGYSMPKRNPPPSEMPVQDALTPGSGTRRAPAISASNLEKETSPPSGPHPASSVTARKRYPSCGSMGLSRLSRVKVWEKELLKLSPASFRTVGEELAPSPENCLNAREFL